MLLQSQFPESRILICFRQDTKTHSCAPYICEWSCLLVPRLKPFVPTLKPRVPTLKPSVPTLKPLVPTLKPLVPTLKPRAPSLKPLVPTLKLRPYLFQIINRWNYSLEVSATQIQLIWIENKLKLRLHKTGILNGMVHSNYKKLEKIPQYVVHCVSTADCRSVIEPIVSIKLL